MFPSVCDVGLSLARKPRSFFDGFFGYKRTIFLSSSADDTIWILIELYHFKEKWYNMAKDIPMNENDLLKKAEEAIHVMAETAGRLDVSGATSIESLVDLCQRCRGNLLDYATEYWKCKIEMEKKDND